MEIGGGDRSATRAALYPQIDRIPAYYHRMMAHPFPRAAEVVDASIRIQANSVPPAGYYETRLAADHDRVEAYIRRYEDEAGSPLGCGTASRESLIVACISHTYHDIFNNPMQGFLPGSPTPCGQWELWLEVEQRDYRRHLYQEERIERLRSDLFDDEHWPTAGYYGLAALAEAMVIRTANAALVPIARELIDNAIESLGFQQRAESAEVADACEFFEAHEVLLVELIREHSRPLTRDEAERWAGDKTRRVVDEH